MWGGGGFSPIHMKGGNDAVPEKSRFTPLCDSLFQTTSKTPLHSAAEGFTRADNDSTGSPDGRK